MHHSTVQRFNQHVALYKSDEVVAGLKPLINQ
jgi:hypothetical protein